MKQFSQTLLLAVVVTSALMFGLKLFLFQKSLLAIWGIALTLGFILYRSGICFASMYQNLFLFKEYSMARAMLLFVLVSFIGINIYQVYAVGQGLAIPGRFHSFGIHTAIGAFFFGIGMTLAGGCAAGTLQRVGEGFTLFLLVMLGMFLGSTTGAYHFSWWVTSFFSHKPIILADIFGWIPAWFGTVLFIVGLFCLTFILEKKSGRENRNDS